MNAALLNTVARPFQARALHVSLGVLLIAAPAAAQSLTYARDIAPLIVDRCAMCHHPGGSAPFSLLTYADAKRRATQIAAVTKSRFMPPWKADPGDGPFVGQHPLSDAEIRLIERWAGEAGWSATLRAGLACPFAVIDV